MQRAQIAETATIDKKPGRKFGLVLGGGGARGLTHIGVLRVLEQAGIKPNLVVGASMGGVIAAAYAIGLNSTEVEEALTTTSGWQNLAYLSQPGFHKGGIVDGRKMEQFFDGLTGGRSFADTKLPMAVVAVDLHSQREVVISTGKLAPALCATTAVPFLFTPYEYKGRYLVDGGFVNNLPVDVVRAMGADFVVGIDVVAFFNGGIRRAVRKRLRRTGPLAGPLEVLERAHGIATLTARSYKHTAYPPDLLLCPGIPARIMPFTGYSHAKALIAIGERAARKALPRIEARL